MPWPNFFIIGQPRSGTTSLFDYLKQHPDVFMSRVKEPYFFAVQKDTRQRFYNNRKKTLKQRIALVAREERIVSDLKDYLRLFKDAKGKQAIGEASTEYFYSSLARKRIKRYIPNAKIIVLLRNTVDRIYSAYHLCFNIGIEDLSFAEAFKESQVPYNRKTRQLFGSYRKYFERGFVCKYLKPYLNAFDNVKIILFDDFINDPLGVTHDVFRFLEVDDKFLPKKITVLNKKGVAKNKSLEYLFLCFKFIVLKLKIGYKFPVSLKRLAALLQERNMAKEPLSEDMRKYLVGLYREDILQLQDLIQRDLSSWLR